MNKLVLGLDLSSVNSGYSVMGYSTMSRPSIGGNRPADGDLIDLYSTARGLEDEPSSSILRLTDYGSIIPNKKMNHAQKLKFIYDSITAILDKYPDVGVVAMEDQHFRTNASTLKLLSRISGVAMLAAEEHGCEIVLYPAATVKKGFTGNGRAEKQDMINMAVERYGLDKDKIDDNIADSIGVAYTYYNS